MRSIRAASSIHRRTSRSAWHCATTWTSCAGRASAPAGRRRWTTPIGSGLPISSTGSWRKFAHNERMKLQMHSNSLFAVLLRSPWWVAGLVVAGTFGATRLFLPTELALFVALPFAVIAAYVGWKQLRAPSARRTAATLERLRAMSWDEFSVALAAGYRREGFEVKRLVVGRPAGADFELVQGSRSTLLACKRWKAMRTG